MFETGRYTENFQTLFTELKQYLELQKKYLAMDAADKMAVILSAVAIAAICLVLSAMVLLFAMFALGYYIGQLTDNLALGFLVITLLLLCCLILFYNKRRDWILQPIARKMLDLFSDKEEEEDPEV